MLPTQHETKGGRWFRTRVPFGNRLLLSVLAAGLPVVVLCLILLWSGPYSLDHKLEGTAFSLISWLALSFSARQTFIDPIRVLANVIGSLKEEDFSFRAAHPVEGDALGELAIEINSLARALKEERLGALEAASLLRKVMAEVGAAIFTFSPDGRVHLLNRAATALMGRNEEQILRRTASELGIADLMEGPTAETITRSFGGMEKRWLLRRTWFRQHGMQHRLVVLSEASEALRAEERMAWQRLMRVLSHEINNSLAPIKSIAHTLAKMPAILTLPVESRDNLKHGFEIISNRAESLNRFLQSYAKLAKLPPPKKKSFDLSAVVQRVASLESSQMVTVSEGPLVKFNVDAIQLEHALINLVKNAVEAVLIKGLSKTEPDSVVISWKTSGADLEISVRDCGIGLAKTENLFVPFYTTKETGSGIGLILCRQIVENHGGQLTIQNRKDMEGCEVLIRIPDCIMPNENNRTVGIGRA